MKSILLMGMLALMAGPDETTAKIGDNPCQASIQGARIFRDLVNQAEFQNTQGMPGKEAHQNAQGMPSQNARGEYAGCKRVVVNESFNVLACPMKDGTTMYTNVRKKLTEDELKLAEKRALKRKTVLDHLARLAKENRTTLQTQREKVRWTCQKAIPQCIEAGEIYVSALELEIDKLSVKVYKLPGETTKIFNLTGAVQTSKKRLEYLRDTKDSVCPKMAQLLGIQLR